MTETRPGILAILSLIFSTLLVSILRNDYNHSHQAFSELGELDASYYLFFNIFAFIIPGVLILYSFRNIPQYLQIESRDILSLKIAFVGWILTGIFPLSYSISWLYWLHIISAVIAFIFGPLGVIKISVILSNKVEWAYFSLFSTIIAFLIWGAILLGDLYFHAAIAQLVSISLFFIWYLLFLLKINTVTTSLGSLSFPRLNE